MQKKHYALLLLVLLSASVWSQDFDVYPIMPDSRLKIPEMSQNQTFKEMEILQVDLRMKDMMYAMIVPGYVHFRANDDQTAYTLLATRTLGFMSIAYMGLDAGYQFRNLWDWDFQTLADKSKSRAFLYTTLSAFAFTAILGSYFYDWIRGQYILQKKQNAIRYKFGMKLQIESLRSWQNTNQNTVFPGVSLTLNF